MDGRESAAGTGFAIEAPSAEEKPTPSDSLPTSHKEAETERWPMGQKSTKTSSKQTARNENEDLTKNKLTEQSRFEISPDTKATPCPKETKILAGNSPVEQSTIKTSFDAAATCQKETETVPENSLAEQDKTKMSSDTVETSQKQTETVGLAINRLTEQIKSTASNQSEVSDGFEVADKIEGNLSEAEREPIERFDVVGRFSSEIISDMYKEARGQTSKDSQISNLCNSQSLGSDERSLECSGWNTEALKEGSEMLRKLNSRDRTMDGDADEFDDDDDAASELNDILGGLIGEQSTLPVNSSFTRPIDQSFTTRFEQSITRSANHESINQSRMNRSPELIMTAQHDSSASEDDGKRDQDHGSQRQNPVYFRRSDADYPHLQLFPKLSQPTRDSKNDSDKHESQQIVPKNIGRNSPSHKIPESNPEGNGADFNVCNRESVGKKEDMAPDRINKVVATENNEGCRIAYYNSRNRNFDNADDRNLSLEYNKRGSDNGREKKISVQFSAKRCADDDFKPLDRPNVTSSDFGEDISVQFSAEKCALDDFKPLPCSKGKELDYKEGSEPYRTKDNEADFLPHEIVKNFRHADDDGKGNDLDFCPVGGKDPVSHSIRGKRADYRRDDSLQSVGSYQPLSSSDDLELDELLMKSASTLARHNDDTWRSSTEIESIPPTPPPPPLRYRFLSPDYLWPRPTNYTEPEVSPNHESSLARGYRSSVCSDSEDSTSWLDKQRAKLRNRMRQKSLGGYESEVASEFEYLRARPKAESDVEDLGSRYDRWKDRGGPSTKHPYSVGSAPRYSTPALNTEAQHTMARLMGSTRSTDIERVSSVKQHPANSDAMPTRRLASSVLTLHKSQQPPLFEVEQEVIALRPISVTNLEPVTLSRTSSRNNMQATTLSQDISLQPQFQCNPRSNAGSQYGMKRNTSVPTSLAQDYTNGGRGYRSQVTESLYLRPLSPGSFSSTHTLTPGGSMQSYNNLMTGADSAWSVTSDRTPALCRSLIGMDGRDQYSTVGKSFTLNHYQQQTQLQQHQRQEHQRHQQQHNDGVQDIEAELEAVRSKKRQMLLDVKQLEEKERQLVIQQQQYLKVHQQESKSSEERGHQLNSQQRQQQGTNHRYQRSDPLHQTTCVRDHMTSKSGSETSRIDGSASNHRYLSLQQLGIPGENGSQNQPEIHQKPLQENKMPSQFLFKKSSRNQPPKQRQLLNPGKMQSQSMSQLFGTGYRSTSNSWADIESYMDSLAFGLQDLDSSGNDERYMSSAARSNNRDYLSDKISNKKVDSGRNSFSKPFSTERSRPNSEVIYNSSGNCSALSNSLSNQLADSKMPMDVRKRWSSTLTGESDIAFRGRGAFDNRIKSNDDRMQATSTMQISTTRDRFGTPIEASMEQNKSGQLDVSQGSTSTLQRKYEEIRQNYLQQKKDRETARPKGMPISNYEGLENFEILQPTNTVTNRTKLTAKVSSQQSNGRELHTLSEDAHDTVMGGKEATNGSLDSLTMYDNCRDSRALEKGIVGGVSKNKRSSGEQVRNEKQNIQNVAYARIGMQSGQQQSMPRQQQQFNQKQQEPTVKQQQQFLQRQPPQIEDKAHVQQKQQRLQIYDVSQNQKEQQCNFIRGALRSSERGQSAYQPVYENMGSHTRSLSLPSETDILEMFGSDFAKPTSASCSTSYGAACSVLYLASVDTESLTGAEAVNRAVEETFASALAPPQPVVVHFRASYDGITLTDIRRRLFFRRHYSLKSITYCGVQQGDQRFSVTNEDGSISKLGRIFGVVAHKPINAQGVTENSCHLFSELESAHSVTNVTQFVTRLMVTQASGNNSEGLGSANSPGMVRSADRSIRVESENWSRKLESGCVSNLIGVGDGLKTSMPGYEPNVRRAGAGPNRTGPECDPNRKGLQEGPNRIGQQYGSNRIGRENRSNTIELGDWFRRLGPEKVPGAILSANPSRTLVSGDAIAPGSGGGPAGLRFESVSSLQVPNESRTSVSPSTPGSGRYPRGILKSH